MKVAAFATVLLLASAGAMAAPPAEQPTATAAVAAETDTAADESEPPQEKVVCRTERTTGSRTRRTRTCMTEAQWRDVRARTYKGLGDLSRSSGGAFQDRSGGAGPR